MKGLYLVFILFTLSQASFGQKTYKIGDVVWTYSKPEQYIYRTDNFFEIVKTGEDYLKNEKAVNLNPEEEVLLAIAKEKDADFNILIASYITNRNIERFTLKGYVEKLVDLFSQKFEELKTPIETTTNALKIDNRDFLMIKNIVLNPQKTYTTYMFVAEIGNKELNFTIITDNASDEKEMLDSILNSKF